jgi:hypothetical protein
MFLEEADRPIEHDDRGNRDRVGRLLSCEPLNLRVDTSGDLRVDSCGVVANTINLTASTMPAAGLWLRGRRVWKSWRGT